VTQRLQKPEKSKGKDARGTAEGEDLALSDRTGSLKVRRLKRFFCPSAGSRLREFKYLGGAAKTGPVFPLNPELNLLVASKEDIQQGPYIKPSRRSPWLNSITAPSLRTLINCEGAPLTWTCRRFCHLIKKLRKER